MASKKKSKKSNQNVLIIAVAAVAVICIALAIFMNVGGKNRNGGALQQPVATDFVQIDIENYGTITAELYGNIAPITVQNFMKLVDEGFYDGLTFHRIISGFMIQGGDPLGTGMGGAAQKIKGEFKANGVENNIAHTRGVLSMARSQAYDSASSQFFIMHADASHLDGQYAAFGRVISGIEVVDTICKNTPVTDRNGSVSAENQPIISRIVRIEKPAE